MIKHIFLYLISIMKVPYNKIALDLLHFFRYTYRNYCYYKETKKVSG